MFLNKAVVLGNLQKPDILFCVGFAAVLLSMTVSIPPVWDTFMYPWRVELLSSLFLAAALTVAFARNSGRLPLSPIPRGELKLIVLPLGVFVAWSALSIGWAASPRAALYHTLIWAEYLIFYLFVSRLLAARRTYRRLLATVSLSLAFFGILAAFAYAAFLVFGGTSRIGIVYSKFGEQAITVFPLVLFGVVRLRGRRFAAGAAVVAAFSLLVVCSLSRANLIIFCAIFAAAAVYICAFRRLRRYRLRLAALLAAAVAAPMLLNGFVILSESGDLPVAKRLGDKQAIGGSNDFRKLMISISGEMIRANPLIGVGAGNFGFETNKYREIYAGRRPDDPSLAQAESNIPERAHNEYLQIAAELGLVGTAVFALFLIGVAALAFRWLRHRRGLPPEAFAALLGVAAFLASSLVTSFSFRLMQNGLVFFFVLAAAARFVSTAAAKEKPATAFLPSHDRFAYAATIAACLTLAALSGVRVASSALTTRANYIGPLEKAAANYRAAAVIDSQNADARYYYGLRLFEAGRYADAVPLLKESIRIGRAPAVDFSYLASAQKLAGDTPAAERTFAEAARLYPRSPFVLSRLASLMRENGKIAEADAAFERAAAINPSAANTWRVLIESGSQKATDTALKNESYAAVMDLQPNEAIYAVLTERDILFPDERPKLPFERLGTRNE